MTDGSPLDSFHRRFREAEAGLERADPGEREQLRAAIVSLFRDTEATLDELTRFKETIRSLVERYKERYPAPGARAPEPPPARVRVDHLGSSTYAERAWSAIAAGHFELAAEQASRALELAPDDTRAATLLGWAQAGMGAAAEARRTLDAVLARDPDHALARTCLGLAALRQGLADEAVQHLQTVLLGSSDRKALLYAQHYLGMALAAMQRHREARDAFARALQQGPNLIEAYWETGRSFYTEGNLQDAAEAWRTGAETNRFNPWAERCLDAVECLRAGRPVPLD